MLSSRVVSAFFLALLYLSILSLRARAQSEPAPNYSSFSAEQLITEADRLKAAKQFTPVIADAIAQRAVVLLLDADFSDQASANIWGTLAELAQPAIDTLTAEQKAQLAARLAASPVNITAADFNEFRSRVLVEKVASTSRDAITDIVTGWLAGHQVSDLSIDQAVFCFSNYRQHPEKRKKFSAIWTGMVIPPLTGDYTFSTSPINLNKELGSEWVRHSIRFALDGTPVITAGPANWQWRSAPVSLQAGASSAIRMEVDFDCSVPLHSEIPSALLFWEGPGIGRQIVPATALRLPDGTGSGVRGEYHCTNASGQPEQRVQVDPVIDMVWATSTSLAPRNPQLGMELSQRIWQLCTDPAFIQSCIAPAAGQQLLNIHPYFSEYYNTEFLSQNQRRQFLILLVEQPELLRRASHAQMLTLYRKLRFGAEDEALSMVGSWMQLNADVEPTIADNFFAGNRAAYRHWTLYLVWQFDQYQRFQDDYLEMPDGRCALPVAYALGYCYLMKGNLSTWIALVDEKLQEPSITGDRRVNWLLARAMAEELRDVPPDRHFAGGNNVSSGIGWLDEAALAAESPQTSLRIRKERIARLAGTQQWAAVEEELEGAPAELNAVASQVESLQEQARLAAQQQLGAAREAQIAELTRRRQKASEQGDSVAVARFTELINSLEQAPQSASPTR